MECPKCRKEIPESSRFCKLCGAGVERACPQCQHANDSDARFCSNCGADLDQPPTTTASATAASARPPLAYTPPHLAERILKAQEIQRPHHDAKGERKNITALFADIERSMELLEALGPDEAQTVIDPILEIMMGAVHRYEGFVAQSEGDGIFALFGAPIGHEDHPQRALFAALLMQERVKELAEKLRFQKDINIFIRVGINSGDVVLRSIRKDDLHADYVPVGHSVSLASRMQTLAGPGSVVVSESTYKLAEGYFQFRPMGVAQIRGASKPVEVYEVLRTGSLRTRLQIAARRGLVHFVGRDDEMQQIKRCFELSQGGHGQIAAVMGEPGVGKSRLCYEFKQAVQERALVLETFSVSHGKAYPYLPLIDLLKNYFQIIPGDDERRRKEKITGKVLALDRSLEDALVYLYALLGVSEGEEALQETDPQIRRMKTFESIKRILLRESLNQTILIIFEDLHWLDSETQDFLSSFSESVASASVLLLVNYRPEYQHGWGSKTYYTQLRLDPLDEANAKELLATLLGEAEEIQSIAERILTETEGNPFFMEEVVQTLAEEGMLNGERGNYRLTQVPDKIRIPPTVQAVLTARIDRLSAEQKEFLQMLAVTGKEFAFGILESVSGKTEDDLNRLLYQLQEGEFIYEQPAFPEPEYTFKHALTQQVAYESVLLETRKVLHERVAQAIEDAYGNELAPYFGELAHHYQRSENAGKAVEYLRLGAEQAYQRSAHRETITQLKAALRLLETLPDTQDRTRNELGCRIILGNAYRVSEGYSSSEAEENFQRVLELAEQVGETPDIARALIGLSAICNFRLQLDKAQEYAEKALNIGQGDGDIVTCAIAHRLLGMVLCYRGEPSSALKHFKQAINLYQSEKHRPSFLRYGTMDIGVGSRLWAANELSILGYLDQGFDLHNEAKDVARGLSHPNSLANSLYFAIIIYRLRGDIKKQRSAIEQSYEFSNEHGISSIANLSEIWHGWLLAESGQTEKGIAQIRMAQDKILAGGYGFRRMPELLAQAYGKAEQFDKAVAVVEEELAIANRTGYHRHEADWLRSKGELLLQQAALEGEAEKSKAAAEECFQLALDVARKQETKLFELRAAVCLSRLWADKGKKKQAKELLSEIYNWFTEGLDTKYLQEAKALLEEIA